VNRAWGQSRRADLLAFLRAWLAGMRWAKNPANRTEAIKLGGRRTETKSEGCSRDSPNFPPLARLNLPGLESVLKLRTDFGFIPLKGNTLASYYDEEYYKGAVSK
jgi:hypothetical protein